ncbi:uncharacterized protein DSM5745_08549 [Aspergillus mulundensis]|uniref:F-box domain-containing protein n=1 Tax=Aspergillus mulundensis TaxID=1810919 RepID=A0A3D8R448_9EURO|nr:Uncharacterized protein DSM5745_08549 [Aspergillus mulundensis]RDW68789.1 Uncharacterized protein DSM5745_08549 [Aspergillus mulundensis]
MGAQGLEIVRFRGRYYVYYHHMDSYYERLGARIVDRIPIDPKGYQDWLKSMRAEYAAKEHALERHVYEMRDGVKPDYSLFDELEELPSELPKFPTAIDPDFFYIINLDREVLTMDYSVHWKLGNIPRQDDLWLRAIVDSIFWKWPTISLDICPEEHMASPALALPEKHKGIRYSYRVVTPKTNLADARKVFLTNVMATTPVQYEDAIINFGMEWSPDSFPFRELVFALVSIASGHASFHSFPPHLCNPQHCASLNCTYNHLPKSPGWLDKEWAGDAAPLREFGSMAHRPGDPPGASPTETMYWVEDVLVSLVLVVDGKAITNAGTWGIGQGRTNFQLVILSLFDVSFAEVSFGDGGGEPLVKVTKPVYLSPLRADHCLSTHPRMRPELKPGMKYQRPAFLTDRGRPGTRRRLQRRFPGLAALVNFFDAAAKRRAASKSPGILPPELYSMILDFTDYGTWKACSMVSTAFRSLCLRKYRLDDRMRIAAGPFVRLQEINGHRHRLLSFDFENILTGEVLPMIQDVLRHGTNEYNWMPVIGGDRRVLMSDVVMQYELAEDMPVEAEVDGEQ